MTELEVIKMLAAYSKELAETDGLGEKGLVQINWAKRLIQALHKPVVMQAEGSDVSEGATVGNRAAGQSGSVEKCNCRYPKYNGYTCSNCDLPYY